MQAFRDIERFFRSVENEYRRPSNILLRRGLSEAWFSDTLGWLMDPKGGHGLGVTFVNALVRRVAKARSDETATCEGCRGYERRKCRLTRRRQERGTLPSALTLANGTPVREFFLSSGTGKRPPIGPRFCDLLFLDLDSKDGFVLAIENKLFTKNHPGQLASYFGAIETKFARAKVREFLYLTLTGECPVVHRPEDKNDCRRWVRMSWVNDVKAALGQSINAAKRPDAEVVALMGLLQWISAVITPTADAKRSTTGISDEFVASTSECLIEELNRISAGDDEDWSIVNQNQAHCKIKHRSLPKSRLHVELQSNYDLSIQGRLRTHGLFERIVLPLGCHPDQMFNLIDVAAREIHHGFFSRPAVRLGSNRRLRKVKSSAKKRHDALFRFMHKRRFELRVLLAARGMYARD